MPLKSRTATVAGSRRNSVEVLLAENVKSLGDQGEIVRVKPGYARNYLLPQGLATVATEHNKKMVERHRKQLAKHEADHQQSLRQLGDAINKYSVTLEANANKENQLYGSIVAIDISKALKTAGYDVSPEQVALDGPLKQLGMYTVKLQLSSQVQTEVKVWVVPVASEK